MNRRKLLGWLAALPFAPKALVEAKSAWDTDVYAVSEYPPTGLTLTPPASYVTAAEADEYYLQMTLRAWRPGMWAEASNPAVLAAAYLSDEVGIETDIDWGAVDAAAALCDERIAPDSKPEV